MIVVVDPGAATTNLGDKIISDAIRRQLIEPLRSHGEDVRTIPMHGSLGDSERSLLEDADDVIVSGTNLLSDHMRFRRSWQWARADIERTRGKLTMFGVGWWQYQRTGIDPISGAWMRSLAGDKAWAVRDVYSAERLNRAGVRAVHTSCPTLWGSTTQTLPSGQSRVVVTLTDYNQERAADEWLVAALQREFDELVFWPQGPGDASYISSLAGTGGARVLDPTVDAFDTALGQPSTAYVGLRLHGGIRAIQMNVPSLILSVDNRAREIRKSVGLAAPSRFALNEIDNAMTSGADVALDLPTGEIEKWTQRWTP